jgi:methionyl-tRNA formyltransferase
MRVVKALDAGPMLAKDHRAIGPDETSDEVERDLARLGARLLPAVVDQFARGHAQGRAQDEAAATYAHRLKKDDGLVDWAWPAVRVHNLIRGLHPWPHAFSFLHGRRLILIRSRPVAAGPDAPGPSEAATRQPGTILEASGERLVVATGAGSLQLLHVQAEGKRPMSAREFLAGHRLTAGDRFMGAP